jgi:hypothetical protein
VLYVDDHQAGAYCLALHAAARRFWEMHRGKNFYISCERLGPEELRVTVRAHKEMQWHTLVVQIGGDPEEAILVALEQWWAGRN